MNVSLCTTNCQPLYRLLANNETPAEPAESGGVQDPYSDASAKYGPLKLPELQTVDLSKMYGGAAQVSYFFSSDDKKLDEH